MSSKVKVTVPEVTPATQSSMFRDVLVGAETGILKGVDLDKQSWSNVNNVDSASREKQIDVMCWGDSQETQVYVGLRNRCVQVYDLTEMTWKPCIQVPGTGSLKGLAIWNRKLVTCSDEGVLQVCGEEAQPQISVEVGEDIHRMRQNTAVPNLVATGGKENALKVIDLNKPEKAVFTAKNVRNDWLNLRVPVWVTDMSFLAGSQKVMTCTGYHQVRLYDPSTPQRRPVLQMEFDEYPLTSLSVVPNTQQVIVGNTQGSMGLLDLRKGQLVQRYKGFAGSIRCIQCHPTMPLVASCGLDRFLRVHDIQSRQLIHKFYLKSRLNCLLFSAELSASSSDSDQRVTQPHTEQLQQSDEDLDDDEMWSKMETVGHKTHKRKAETSGTEQGKGGTPTTKHRHSRHQPSRDKQKKKRKKES